jgi:hypothetical protein
MGLRPRTETGRHSLIGFGGGLHKRLGYNFAIQLAPSIPGC